MKKKLPSLKETSIIPNSSGLSGLRSGNLKHKSVVTESLFSDRSSKTHASAMLKKLQGVALIANGKLSSAEKETKVMSKAKDDHNYFCQRNKKQDGKREHKLYFGWRDKSSGSTI